MMSLTSRQVEQRERRQQFVTIRLDDMLLGVDIQLVQEINRQVTTTPVPHAPNSVKGVINLRGDVVTLMDLRVMLGMPPMEQTSRTRNVIIELHGERTGFLVDEVADVVTINRSAISPKPANLRGLGTAFFSGVYQGETDLIVILDMVELLHSDTRNKRAS